MVKKLSAKEKELGLDAPITRRDFVGNTLVGAGAGLLMANAPGVLASSKKNKTQTNERWI